MTGVSLFMAAICIWSLYDGFVAWPRKNSEFDQVRPALLATNLSARAWLSKTGANGATPLDQLFAGHKLPTPKKLVRNIDETKIPENLPESQLTPFRERESKALQRIFESPLYSEGDLKGQVVMAVISALVSLWVALAFVPKIRRRYVADDTGLHGNGVGAGLIRYDDIASMDWKLWDKKGIARICLKDDTRYTLDCWHFNGMKDVVETILEHRPELSETQ